MAEDDRLFYSISATTRAPRSGETDGVQYYFLTRADFERKIAQNAFWSTPDMWIIITAHSKRRSTKKLAEGYDVILEIEVQGRDAGASEASGRGDGVYRAPVVRGWPRLRGRGTEDEERCESAWKPRKRNWKSRDRFDYVVVNDEIDRAVRELQGHSGGAAYITRRS